MLPDPNRNWTIWIFIGSFVFVSLFMFGPYILFFIVCYSKGILCTSSPQTKMQKKVQTTLTHLVTLLAKFRMILGGT